MEINFEGKRALVTGGGRGIGKAIAIQLAKCGAQVVVVSKTEENLIKLKNEEPSIETVALDLSDWTAAEEGIRTLGTFDFLVNNAGLLHVEPIGDISTDTVDRLFELNVKATLNVSQVVVSGMKSSGKGGAIVNISSVVGVLGFPGLSLYAATKGALNQLTKTMAIECGPYGIRVNCVSPAVVNTDMSRQGGLTDLENPAIRTVLDRTPIGRFGEIADVVGPVIFLLSDMARWVTGINLPIDGGYSAW